MFFQLIAIIITLSLYNSIPIKVIQDLFCINCKQLIQESKKSGICNASNKYKNSLDLTEKSHQDQQQIFKDMSWEKSFVLSFLYSSL